MSTEEVVEDEITYYVFVKEGRRHFAPQYMAAGATTVQHIFPVPESNAVGTLDKENNGIAFVKFGGFGMEPECKVVAKDLCSEADETDFNCKFSSNFSEDTIVYSQNQIAVIANVKTGEAFHAGCGLSLDDYMLGIWFLDPQKNMFVIIKSIYKENSGWEDSLHIVKLKDQQFVDTAWAVLLKEPRYISSDFSQHQTWLVHNKNLFVYDQSNHHILCTNGEQSVPHPFAETFNNNSDRIGRVKDFLIHPKLPFGVIIEERAADIHDLTVLRWDITNPKKRDEQVVSFNEELEPLKSLFDLKSVTLAYQSFSPDGNWYVAGCISPDAPESPHFIAIPVTPVDEDTPDFFDMDDIVVLGQVENMTSLAWTSEPSSYVVSNGEILNKWDFGELPNARVFVMPGEDDGTKKKTSIFRKAGRLFGIGR